MCFWKFIRLQLIIQELMGKSKLKAIQEKYGKPLNQSVDNMSNIKEVFLQMNDATTEESSPKKKKELKVVKDENKSKEEDLWPIYKQFFGYTLKRWQWAIFCVFISLFSGFLNSIFPLRLGVLLDTITNQAKVNNQTEAYKEELKFSMISLGILTLGIGVATFVRYYSLANFQQQLGIDLKKQIFSTFIRNDMHFFEINQSNALVSRITNDVNQAKSAVSNNLTYMLRNFITILSSLIILLIMSWKLTLFLIAMIPIYVYVNMAYARRAKKLVKERQDIQAQISQHLGEKFCGISTIKSYGTQEKEINKYNKEIDNTYEVEKNRIFYQAIQMSVSSALPSVGAVLVLTFAGIQLLQGEAELTAGQLTSFVLYCNILSTSTNALSSTYSNLITGISAIQKVISMMKYQRTFEEEVGGEIDLDGTIQFDRVEFKYPNGSQALFEDLNFKIKKGEYVGFIGQSGSGKSTITKLILGFYKLQNGDIVFNDDRSGHFKDLNMKKLRQQIGFVNQEATLFTGTIEENITYGLKQYTMEDLEEACRKAGCLQFIENLELFPDGYQTQVGERGNRLSGGQRQRIAIARALMRKPKIIIFDEATSALDSNNETVVQKSIQDLFKNKDITIIVIAHRLSTVVNCDRLYVMKEGKIVESGSHKNLLSEKGYYYSLIEKQLHDKEHQM